MSVLWHLALLVKRQLSSVCRRLTIEVIEYDDRSNAEETIRAVERLVNQDKVDLGAKLITSLFR